MSMKSIAKQKKICHTKIKAILESNNISFEEKPKINVDTVNEFLAKNFKDLLAIDLKREIKPDSDMALDEIATER